MNIAIDSGMSIDKYALFNDDGDIIFGKSMSVYAPAPFEADDMPMFEGQRYYTGEEALMEGSGNIIDVIDYKGHEKFAPLSIFNVLERLKIDNLNIDKLIVGLSLAQKDYANQFIKRISKFKVNGNTYDFSNKLILIPQGVSAKYAIDHYYYEDNHTESYGIIDIGQLTVDLVNVINGKVRSENASGMSHEGTIKIIQKLQELIVKKFNEFISVKEAQEVLLTGKFNVFGEKDLSVELDGLKIEYSEYLVSMLNQKYKNIFKKYSRIYFVGGGAYYINKDYIQKITGHTNIIIPKNSEYYNAIGGLLFSTKGL